MGTNPYESYSVPVIDSMSTQLVDGKTFGLRSVAFLVDAGIFMGLNSVYGNLFNQAATEIQSLIQKSFHVEIERSAQSQNLSLPMAFILLLIYFALFEGLFGATPGKWVLRMRVIRADGRPCGLFPALFRGVARLIDGLILGMVAALSMAAPLRQRLGDKWARTLVVSSRDPFIQRGRSFWFFLLAFFLFSLLVFPLSQAAHLLGPVKEITPLIASGAGDFNLQIKDLGAGFSLSSEHNQDNLNDQDIFESNSRTFISRSRAVSAQVILYTYSVSDISAVEIRDVLDKSLREEFGNDLETKAQRITSLGKSSWALQYGDKTSGKDIIALIVARQNILVEIAIFGASDEVNFDRAEAFAKLILDRAESNYHAPNKSNRIGYLDR